MKSSDAAAISKGFKEAIPIGITYFVVSLAIGINAVNGGFSPIQSAWLSFLNLTSAGQVAGIEIISEHGSLSEIIFSQIAINLRYLLMAAALTIKLSPNSPAWKRMLMAMGITDENFALTTIQPTPVNPLYTFGCYLITMPSWVLGTYIGATSGNIFPEQINIALEIAVYAMFTALTVTPARKNIKLLLLIIISWISSWAVTIYVPQISYGTRVIMLTFVLSSIMALLFPVKEDNYEQ